MNRIASLLALACAALLLGAPAGADERRYAPGSTTIVLAPGSDPLVEHAASELRAYAFLRTGSLPPIAGEVPPAGPAIVLRVGGGGERVPEGGPDPAQNHAIYVESEDPLRIVVHGTSPVATSWAAWSLVESWGFGFYLGGDAIPPRDPAFEAVAFERRYVPVLRIRGCLPWFNFLNSPTTWNPEDYRTFLDFLARQKANFVGFHAYDHEPFGAYSITRVRAELGGPLMTTISPTRWWSPPAMSTKDFPFGTDLFFDRGEWGCEVGIEDAWAYAPGRAVGLQQRMMADALAHARRRGIRTCLGWEVSGDPDDPAVRERFRRRLEHTLATYPLDYFWIWQSEGRGTGGRDEGVRIEPDLREAFAYLGAGHDLTEAARIAKFVRLAHETLRDLAPGLRLVVSGWGGDEWMRFSTLYPGLDRVVPGDVVFAALDNIDPRLSPRVAEAYGRLSPSRERWPIPWFESDAGHTRIDQTGPQTNVTAFEPLLGDLVAKGCQGALGIHWRTRNVEDVAGYLFRAGWERDLTPARFFGRYAADRYGPDLAGELATVHLELEALGPQYVGAAGAIECATPFTWFAAPPPGIAGGGPNLAGHLPDPERMEKAAAIGRRFEALAASLEEAGDLHAARAASDRAAEIRWLLGRARVGTAIWNGAAPLERRLRDAERRHAAGEVEPARLAARAIAHDLQALDFAGAMRSLASTCRTRGELGMLATANARYGRFYASFADRVDRLLGPDDPPALGEPGWDGEPALNLFPVPGRVGAGEPVVFNAVAVGLDDVRLSIRLRSIDGGDLRTRELPMRRLGGSSWRATFRPEVPGVWEWRLEPEDPRIRPRHRYAGVLSAGPAPAPVAPSSERPSRAPRHEPTLRLSFDEGLPEAARALGEVEAAGGVHGQALETRSGGRVVLPDAASRGAAIEESFTVAFFVRPEPWNAASDWPVLLSKGAWDEDGWFVQLYQGSIRFGLGRASAFDAATLEPGRWTHVAYVLDGGELRLYLDGEVAGSLDVDHAPAPSARPLVLGAYTEDGRFPFAGRLDEVRIYERPLPPDEVRRLAAGE